MATKGNMKGFYRQKKNSGITKAPSNKNNKRSPKNAASFGSDVTQPPALISHGSLDVKDGYGEQEEVLRQFDMNMTYGPCLGMNRLARWERANKLGLKPPKEVEGLLKGGKAQNECLWEGRI